MKLKKIFSLLLSAVIAVSLLPSYAANTASAEDMSAEEAVAAVYAEFSKAEYGKISSPLIFPLEYNGTTYSNVVSYIKAWAYENTKHDITVNYTPYIYTTTYEDWSSGTLLKKSYDGMDADGNIISDYFTNNQKKTMNRLDNLSFSEGEYTSAVIKKIYVPVRSLERTPQEIADYVAEQFPFERIKGGNTSADNIINNLGKSTTSSELPNSCGLYSTSATVTWKAENVSGSKNALTVSSSRAATVKRPNVGEEDAVFDLVATATAKSDTSATATKVHRLTIPSFDGVTVPILVPSGAKLEITDKYYPSTVDDKYIALQDNAPEGFDLYHCTLHTAADGTAQEFGYAVSKEGYLTKSGTFTVSEGAQETIKTELSPSTENDTLLKSLVISSGNSDGFTYDPAKTAFSANATGQYVTIKAEAETEGATVTASKRYSSVANANNNKTSSATFDKNGEVKCFLPDKADTTTTVEITVKAPAGSTQAQTERVYTLEITKSTANGPLTGFVVKASSSGKGVTDNYAEMNSGVNEEETLSPTFVAGSAPRTYNYSVNYNRDKISITPTFATGYTATVNGETVASKKASSEIALKVGDNEIPVVVSKGDYSAEYKVIVRRKAEFYISGITFAEGVLNTEPVTDGSKHSVNGVYDYDAESINLVISVNTAEAADVTISFGGKSYSGVCGEPINIPIGNANTAIPYISIAHTVDGVREGQTCIAYLTRSSATGPNSVESFLPAPGQFVNQDNEYNNPKKTLNGSAKITLGAFGGNVVYKYDTPIKNDAKNPYGVDFIITGNCFTNDDGSTSSGAAEPAAVMVSKDGVTWYELAGSEYYTADAEKNVTITYTNNNPDFSQATEVPWSISGGDSGVMPINSYHTQCYYPNPARFNAYQKGVGKNESYTAESVTFSGTMINYGFYPFGYADTHSQNTAMKNLAANPYAENHTYKYNGDGFDISWAVDANGDPVELDEISYIKIYNPVLSYGTSRGEISPEILSVNTALAQDEKVGVSGGLKSLTVNGENVRITDGTYRYTIDGKGASSLKITPVTENANANIYVSNRRVSSGSESKSIAAVDKMRIIVQEDNKEPQIYILDFENVATKASNADLTSLTLIPGDEKKFPSDTDSLGFSTDNSVSAMRIIPELANKKATAVLSGGTLNEPITFSHNTQSKAISLNVGNNDFTLIVTSENGKITKSYAVTVTRADRASTPTNTISVRFSLIGDIDHLNNGLSHKEQTWISERTVNVPKGSTVKYLTELMLNNAKIDYVSNGIYISEINGLGEFDNGRNSGWLYRCNGLIADVGYADKILSDNDVIKWFYTDDYTLETGYEGGYDNTRPSSTAKDNTSITEPDDSTKSDDTATSISYSDVKKDSWYFEAVNYVSAHNLMQGTGKGFSPDTFMTRAMLVTVLYRMESTENDAVKAVFDDVSLDTWFAESVSWAAENGIVSGVNEKEFAPDTAITREQLAVIIYRYAKFKGYDTTPTCDLTEYSDADSISEWALDAMRFAVASNLISGTGNSMLSPKSTATRAQVAEILMRFCENIKK